MKLRHGRFGAFLGCTNYPSCKGIVNIPKKGEVAIDQQNMPPCPAVGCTGHMVGRKSRFGKTFYSCSTFPECDVIVNDIEQLETKYQDHPRTAYVKKAKAGRGRGKKAEATEKKETKPKKASAKKTVVAKEKTTPKKTRTMPSLNISPELASVVGSTTMARGEVLKKVWDYIRAHNLQDPANKRRIMTDATLAKVFGSDEPVDMFKMTGLLSKHMK